MLPGRLYNNSISRRVGFVAHAQFSGLLTHGAVDLVIQGVPGATGFLHFLVQVSRAFLGQLTDLALEFVAAVGRFFVTSARSSSEQEAGLISTGTRTTPPAAATTSSPSPESIVRICKSCTPFKLLTVISSSSPYVRKSTTSLEPIVLVNGV